MQACEESRSQWKAAAPRFEPEFVKTGPFWRHRPGSGRGPFEFLRHGGTSTMAAGISARRGGGDKRFPKPADNVGAYRMMLQEGGRSVTINAEAGKQGRAQYERWFAKAGKAPVLVSFGHDPLLLMVAGTEVPNTISEYAYAGAMVGEKIKVIKGEVTGLPMPAGAEIVVEGWIRPDRMLHERPVRRMDGVLRGLIQAGAGDGHRAAVLPEQPDHSRTPPGKPPNDYSYMRALLKSA